MRTDEPCRCAISIAIMDLICPCILHGYCFGSYHNFFQVSGCLLSPATCDRTCTRLKA